MGMSVVWTRSGKQALAAREGCSGVGCRAHAREALAACAYIDQWGWRCSEPMCSAHGLTFGDEMFCVRHAGFFLTLGGDEPALDAEHADPFGRRPSLMTWVPRLLDRDVRGMLAAAAHAGVGAPVATTQSVRASGTDAVAWETRWELLGPEPRLSVALELEGYCDPAIVVRVGGMVVMRELAEWLRYHIHGVGIDAIAEIDLRVEMLARAHMAINATMSTGDDADIALSGLCFLETQRAS